MATAPFTWIGNQAVTSPEAAKRRRGVADALLSSNSSPKNWTEGLASVLAGFSADKINNDVAAAESEGAASAAAALAGLGPNAGFNDISAALSNPWITQPQASVASALLQQNLERQDPRYQLDMAYKQAQLDALQSGEADQEAFFGTGIPIRNADGSISYGQFGNQGSFNVPTLPEGSSFLTPVEQLNAGTQFIGVDKFGNPTSSVTPINNTGEARDTAIGAGLGAQSLATIEAAKNAEANNAKLGVLQELLTAAPSGAQGRIVQLAGGFGIDLGGLSSVQAAQAVINQLVPLQRAPGSGTMSDMDLELYKQSLPSIINQPEANDLIIRTQRALNDYTIAHGNIERRLVNGEITDQQAAQEKSVIPNPLTEFLEYSRSQPAGGTPAPATGGSYRILGVE